MVFFFDRRRYMVMIKIYIDVLIDRYEHLGCKIFLICMKNLKVTFDGLDKRDMSQSCQFIYHVSLLKLT